MGIINFSKIYYTFLLPFVCVARKFRKMAIKSTIFELQQSFFTYYWCSTKFLIDFVLFLGNLTIFDNVEVICPFCQFFIISQFSVKLRYIERTFRYIGTS